MTNKPTQILYSMPVILTKDPLWKPLTTAKPGAIILLPDDAVLLMIPDHQEDNQ